MPVTSVNPQQPSATPMMQEDTEVGNGIKVPQTPVPGPMPLDTQAMSTMKGSQMEAQAMKSASKSSGGGILGTIGSIVGKAIPFIGGLFAQGGYVNYANGGMTGGMNPDNTYGPGQTIEPGPAPQPGNPGMNEMLGMVYALGALHQRDFGGTPETLEQAAQVISQKFGGQTQGFAGGGNVQQPMPPDPNQMMQTQVMPQRPMTQVAPAPRPMQSPVTNVAPAPRPMPAQPQQGFMQQHPALANRMQQNRQQPQGLATGGPPLEPGQPFMGEGEVKGPGGPTDDAIPARLSNGEYVMSAPAVAFFGVEKMDKMNEQGKQGFMQSKAQVQANQMQSPGPGAMPPPAAAGMPPMPPGGAMPQMSTMQAQGGPAVQRTRGSGFFAI